MLFSSLGRGGVHQTETDCILCTCNVDYAHIVQCLFTSTHRMDIEGLVLVRLNAHRLRLQN